MNDNANVVCCTNEGGMVYNCKEKLPQKVFAILMFV